MRVLVVIPAYKAADSLPELVERIAVHTNLSDVLIVEDGSPDDTFAVAKKTGAKVIQHEVNQGKGGALKTGFEYALREGYDGVITIDADLQHDPDLLPDFKKMAETDGVHLIIGTRERNLRNMPFARFMTNHMTSLIISCFSGRFVRDSQSGYRYISARALRRIRLESTRYDLESEFLFKSGRAGYTTHELAIPTIYTDSASHINPLVDTGRFIKLMFKSLFW